MRNVEVKIQDQKLILSNIKADPQLECKNLSVDPQKFNAVRIKYRAYQTGPRRGQLYFSRNGSYSDRHKWNIPALQNNGKWHTLILTSQNLVNQRNWQMGGVITCLRFDPTDSAGGCIEIAEITFFDNSKSSVKQIRNELIHIDAPEWPAVKPEFNKSNIHKQVNTYFKGKMICSPHDKHIGTAGKYKRFYLRKKVFLKDTPVEAWMQFVADDSCNIYLNGKLAGCNKNWQHTTAEEVSDLLKKGINAWGISYENNRSAGGVLAELFVKYKDGSWQKFHTDNLFKTALAPGKNWSSENFDDKNWQNVVLQSPPPVSPWTVRLQYFDFLNPQKFLTAHASKNKISAGEKVRIQIDFKGNKPDKAIALKILLDKQNTNLWDEFLTIPVSKIKQIKKGFWKIDFDYTFPLYLESNKMTMTIASESLFIQSGGIPKLDFDYKQLKRPPIGYEQKTITKIERTPYGPALFKNGKPFYMTWGFLTFDRRSDKRAKIADTKFTVMTVFVTFSQENNKMQKKQFLRAVEKVAKDNPDAWIIADISVNPGRKWAKDNP
ncbi:MAG: hypothetical protein IKA32_08935, partial [Lentisphaeria bacterium]|nr:hypothetical protein [Lentisphaeria bacterium]